VTRPDASRERTDAAARAGGPASTRMTDGTVETPASRAYPGEFVAADTVLDGLTVLELGAGSMPAQLAGMLLADNGARVVKVEPPEGDRLRDALPSGFLVWNRGKESLVADLRTAAGRDEARAWAGTADVVLEGFAPGRLTAWGLDPASLRAENPRLVTASVTGFGPSGAYSGLKGYEGVVSAKAGFYSRGDFGFRDGPIYSGVPLAGAGAGHMMFSGVLAALVARAVTGRGQHVDATLVQGLTPTDYFMTTHFQLAQRAGKGGTSTEAAASPGGEFAASRYSLVHCTRDGKWVVLSPQMPHQARALLRAMGLEHTLEDPRFAHAPFFRTAEDAQDWEDMLWEAFRARTWADVQPALLAEEDVPFELAASSEAALDHPQMVHNGHVVEVDDPVVGRVREIGPVARMSKTPSVIARSAPALGEHGDRFTPAEAPAAPTGATVPAHPLAGVTIVEFGFFYAMPFGVTLAASLGARVIKLEDRGGDPIRAAFGGDAGSAKVTEGKESLSIDLKSAAGQAVVRKLLATADVFVVGFRPGVAERAGLDYESLAAVNPGLVYVHSGGYGTDGPYAHRPLYAFAAGACAGNFQRHGGHWMDPSFSADFSVPELQAVVMPHLRGPVDGDSNAALAVCSSILLGLAHKARTGVGQFLSTTMILGNAYSYSDDFNTYAGKPPVPASDPDQYGLGARYRLYRAAEGWVFVAAPRPNEWEALARALGHDEWLADPRFADTAARRAHDGELAALLGAELTTRDATEWEKVLTDAGVGCAAVFPLGHPAFTATDPVMRETGLVTEIEHPTLGPLLRHGLPVQFSETPGRVGTSCIRGQHTDAILAELGYGPDEVARLHADEVVFGP
jgi:crotonobetainyl-CoA:carnitine CoA-transferase CaiB-like acyl-CoA transferase